MIELSRLSSGFGSLALVEDLTISIPAGGTLALIGASGSGKTTLLRTIAGMHPPLSGQVEILGTSPQELYGTGRLQYLHQSPMLWRHLTVHQHIRLALELVGERVRAERIGGILKQVGLAGNEDKYPYELSQGMRTRLALARAFAAPPEVLLMDEPFASLDPLRREQFNLYLQGLRSDAGCTIVMVTHDVVEAMRFASTILIFPYQSPSLRQVRTSRGAIHDPNRLSADDLARRDEIVGVVRGMPKTAEALSP